MNSIRILIVSTVFLILFSCSEGINEKQNNNEPTTHQGWKSYKSPDLSLQYPPDWILSVDTSGGEVFHISRPEQKEAGIIGYDISISYYEEEEDFPGFAKDQTQSMKENYSIEILKEEEISFDSKSSFKYTVIFPTDAGKNEAAEIYFVRGKEKFYQIFNAGMAKHKAQADSIIQTIHLN